MNAPGRLPGHSDGTVGKAMDVLDAVAAAGEPVRFSQLLATGRWPKATLYRLMQTLTSQGLLSHQDGSYTLGLRLIRLAHGAWQQASLAPIAQPFIDQLSAELCETVHLAQMDRGQVLYVDKRAAHNPIPMFSDAGKVGPSYCTGVGKAMLAHLPEDELSAALSRQAFHPHTAHTHTDANSLRAELAEIHKSGVSFDREEHEPTIICVAVPILSRHGTPLGALSVTSTTGRHSLAALARLAPALKSTAAQIAEAAQAWTFPQRDQATP
ncbi:MAG: IclR family transcriptional regulator [Pseudomonadota bacterium]